MNTPDWSALSGLLALVVSVVGAVVAILAYRRSRKAEEADRRYKELQENLTELQWVLMTQKASIVVYFDNVHVPINEVFAKSVVGKRSSVDVRPHLYIKNIGNVVAQNITLSFSVSDIRYGSVPRGLLEINTITRLAPGITIPYSFTRVMGESAELVGEWSWENPDGTIESQRSNLVIPSY